MISTRATFFTLQQIAISYGVLRRYAEANIRVGSRVGHRAERCRYKSSACVRRISLESRYRGHCIKQSIQFGPQIPPRCRTIADDWLSCALAERDAAAAKNALNAFGEIPLTDYAVHLNRPLIEGVIARMTKDEGKARAAFTAARAEQEKAVQAQPNYGPPLCVLGLIDAGLGRKEEALREGRRAVELLPWKKMQSMVRS